MGCCCFCKCRLLYFVGSCSGKDNRELNADENNQKLTQQDIEAMKEKGVAGQVLLLAVGSQQLAPLHRPSSEIYTHSETS